MQVLSYGLLPNRNSTRPFSIVSHPDFKGILTSEWQAAITRYEPVRVSKASKAPVTVRIRKPIPGLTSTRFGQLTTEAPLPKLSHKKPFKVGDRVQASQGTGIIVEVDGEKYLVDLDEQAAQLWEKARGLNKV